MAAAFPPASPCATCDLRASGFCKVAHHPQSATLPLRQKFSGASAAQTIYHRDEMLDDVAVLCHGWAAIVVQLGDGRKQILSIRLAGDLVSSRMLFANKLHFSVQALTDVRVCRIDRADLRARLLSNPASVEAFGHVCLAESKAADELTVDLGRRSAEERIAHLVLSLTERIAERTVIRQGRYPFPLRQQDIADMLGLTPEHVSRIVTKFRKASVFEFSNGSLQVHDREALDRAGRPR